MIKNNRIKETLSLYEKATPGPWEIKREDIGDEYFCNVPVEIIGSDTFPVVSMEGGLAPNCSFTAETLEANAHLIAAAPDMYEVLKEIEGFLDNDEDEPMTIGCHCTDTGTGAPLICPWCKACQALAKAEGKKG